MHFITIHFRFNEFPYMKVPILCQFVPTISVIWTKIVIGKCTKNSRVLPKFPKPFHMIGTILANHGIADALCKIAVKQTRKGSISWQNSTSTGTVLLKCITLQLAQYWRHWDTHSNFTTIRNGVDPMSWKLLDLCSASSCIFSMAVVQKLIFRRIYAFHNFHPMPDS